MKKKAASEPLDLLSLPSTADEDVMKQSLLDHGAELHFNGRLVWGEIVAAIVAGRRDVAASSVLDEEDVTPSRLDIALYHPEEKALYVAVDYLLPGRTSTGVPLATRAERKITKGREPRTVELSKVSIGTTAEFLNLLDVIDLSRVLWLPLRS